mgnify:FL=1
MKSVDVNVIEGTQRWTEQLKACGQSIIDNAEKLADISKFQTELKITISISGHKTPVITADTEWIPEKWVDDHNIGKELQDIRRYLEFNPRIAINSQEIGD